MLSLLIRFLVFLSSILLLGRLVWAMFGSRRRRGVTPSSAPQNTTAMVRDPVCGMYLDPRLAVRVETKKGAFFFCSNECRQKHLGT